MGAGRAIAIVPARLGSTRLPRKVLLRETGRCLFEHTVRNAERCERLARVVLATDAEEVAQAARAAGIEAVLTSAAHPSGTDRVREALDALGGDWQAVVNLQADEPELDPLHLSALVAALEDPAVELATLCAPASPAEAASPSAVKVVRDGRGDALYFSRSTIPSRTHARSGAEATPTWRHVGVYGFRPAALRAFCDLPPSPLEAAESLEQLRWLEAGRRIRVVPVDAAPPGIDTEADYRAFVARCAAARTRR